MKDEEVKLIYICKQSIFIGNPTYIHRHLEPDNVYAMRVYVNSEVNGGRRFLQL